MEKEIIKGIETEKKTFLDYIGFLLLAIFLFSTHAKLFYWLDPNLSNSKMVEFSWLSINEKIIQSEIYGALFGLITVYLFANKRASSIFKTFVIFVAILDGVAVFWVYEIDVLPMYKMFFASLHYSIYTMFIIIMFGFAKNKNNKLGLKIIENNNSLIKRESEIEPEIITPTNNDNILQENDNHDNHFENSYNQLMNCDSQSENSDNQFMNSDNQIEDNSEKIKQMYLANKSPKEIAWELHISQATAYRHIKKLKTENK